ncbi:putative solute:sodium symporter small subunit [Desulfuromonas soudanensis]|uniref:Putative solute:sodium symporter small subunit n=1 Tax=Desulfuromonas soudanensis TaxID=1603606 RepID=A0A0M4D311_9BACT|nr:sodium/substrate symporter small subunit [Desulfuromonas soudanensis]ALC17484.1 putative solute:sodium symporter small subunit [Desulfuromonas soudanensis]
MAARERIDVNFFRPSTPGMKAEARIAASVLIFWSLLSFGIPLLIFLAGLSDPSGLGESFITRARFLGFPLHYWLVAQGCTIGYILLCKLYCLLWDRRVIPARRLRP